MLQCFCFFLSYHDIAWYRLIMCVTDKVLRDSMGFMNWVCFRYDIEVYFMENDIFPVFSSFQCPMKWANLSTFKVLLMETRRNRERENRLPQVEKITFSRVENKKTRFIHKTSTFSKKKPRLLHRIRRQLCWHCEFNPHEQRKLNLLLLLLSSEFLCKWSCWANKSQECIAHFHNPSLHIVYDLWNIEEEI